MLLYNDRNTSIKIIHTLVSFVCWFTFIACSVKNDIEQPVKNLQNIDQSKKNLDLDEAERKKRMEDLTLDLQKNQDLRLDLTASGGQPGKIYLTGAMVISQDNQDEKIHISSKTGKSWRGTEAILDPKSIVRDQQVSENTLKGLEKLEGTKSFYNFGCDLKLSKGLQLKPYTSEFPFPPQGFQEKKLLAPAKDELVTSIQAELVLICDDSFLQTNIVAISAETIFVQGLQLTMSGGAEKMLSLSAKYLILSQQSVIKTTGIDGQSTISTAPGVSLTAVHFAGQGKLSLITQGASYIAEK